MGPRTLSANRRFPCTHRRPRGSDYSISPQAIYLYHAPSTKERGCPLDFSDSPHQAAPTNPHQLVGFTDSGASLPSRRACGNSVSPCTRSRERKQVAVRLEDEAEYEFRPRNGPKAPPAPWPSIWVAGIARAGIAACAAVDSRLVHPERPIRTMPGIPRLPIAPGHAGPRRAPDSGQTARRSSKSARRRPLSFPPHGL